MRKDEDIEEPQGVGRGEGPHRCLMPMRGSAGSGGSTHRFCFTGCLGSTETEGRITPRKTQGNILGEDVGVGGSLLLLDPKSMAAHLTLPGRQKEKTVLGWRRSQSLSQQQFKSQVPGVKSQTQIGKAVQDKVKRDEAPQSFPAGTQLLPAL